LHVADGCITGSMCSDIRLKEKIKPLPPDNSILEKVVKLRGVSFEWRGRNDERRQIGLIAQEVEKVIPELVTTPEVDNGQKGLSCTGLNAVLVEAIKEQQTQISSQQSQIEELRSEIRQLKSTFGAANQSTQER